jgi:hypothetical protein
MLNQVFSIVNITIGKIGENAMESCIICPNPSDGFSLEHIIPLALGGNVTTNECCKKCNEKMGALIDDRLNNTQQMKIIRLILQIKGRNGVQNPFTQLFDTPYPGVKGHIRFDENGNYQGFDVLTKPIVNTENEFVIVGKKPEEVLKAINQKIRRSNGNQITMTEFKKNVNTLPLGRPHINISVYELSHEEAEYLFPALLKIAFEASRLMLGESYESDSIGNEMRSVLNQIINEEEFVDLPTDMIIENFNWSNPKRKHSIRLSASGKKLVCKINLLNFLKASVVVSEDSQNYNLRNVSPIVFSF